MVGYRQEFQRELEAIEVKVNGLFAMVAEDVTTATYALVSGSDEVLGVLAEREQVIDALYQEIDQLASREILLQAPVASDLRFLLSVVRLVPELERSDDLVVQIAARADRVPGDDLSPGSRDLVERMGDVAAATWRQAAGWPIWPGLRPASLPGSTLVACQFHLHPGVRGGPGGLF